MRILRTCLLASGLLVIVSCARAFDLGYQLREYFDAATGHYAMGVRTGVPTGYGFHALAGCYDETTPLCRPVTRFHSSVGPTSYVFTASPGEIESLRRADSGWVEDGFAFRVGVPQADGSCVDPVVGNYGVAVHRIYNLGGFGAANHRYTVFPRVIEKMLARGWVDEGVVFCSWSGYDQPLWSDSPNLFAPASDGNGFALKTPRALSACESDADAASGCIGLDGAAPGTDIFWSENTHVVASLRTDAAPGSLGSVTIMDRPSLWPDSSARVFPWAPLYDEPVTLHAGVASSPLQQKTGPGGDIYGHLTVELADARSGRSILFNVLSFGTMPLGGDAFLARDAHSGKAIVGVSAGPGSPFMTDLQGCALRRAPAVIGPGPTFPHCDIAISIDAAQARRIIEAARTVDPTLSSEPAGYFIASSRFKVEISGTGFIYMWDAGRPGVALRRES